MEGVNSENAARKVRKEVAAVKLTLESMAKEEKTFEYFHANLRWKINCCVKYHVMLLLEMETGRSHKYEWL